VCPPNGEGTLCPALALASSQPQKRLVLDKDQQINPLALTGITLQALHLQPETMLFCAHL
jgi:uncharacterized protein involved in high-affinity Fe2+ transport